MPDYDRIETWEEVKALLERGDAAALNAFLDALSPGQVARAISRLDEDEQHRVLTLLHPGDAADLIEQLTDSQGADLLEDLPTDRAAAIVDEMESHERVDVLAELDSEDVEAILRAMDPEEAEDARKLLTYAEDTAGGLMGTEFVSFPYTHCVSDVVQSLRQTADEYTDYSVQYVYITTPHGRLLGVVRLRDLLLSEPDTPLTSIMIANPLYAQSTTTLDELAHLFERYSFVGLPVIDDAGHMIGVVRRADVEEAEGERAEEALMRFGGIIGGEELRSMPVSTRSGRRLAWLCLNFMLSLVAASVVCFFQETLRNAIQLAFFIPVIANMSGCSGNQAVAVSIRELTLGIVQPRDFVRVLVKEAQIGIINGPVLGTLIAIVAYVWVGSLAFSLVVGLAFAANTMVALAMGGFVPLMLKKLRLDPALAAPLILTTITDMCGFFFVLSLATLALAHLN